MFEGTGHTSKRLRDGDVVFSQGDPAHEMYVIRSGKVRICREHDGKDVTLATLKTGDFFGEMALFERRRRSACARAVGDVELDVMGEKEFTSLVKTPFIGEMLLRMSQRIHETDDVLDKMLTEARARTDTLSALSARRSWDT